MEEDTNVILSKMNAPKAPAAKNANTRQEPRQHAPIDKNGRKDGYMYVVNENNVPVSTLVVRGEGWNKWGDSSADEEQLANRRRIEVILSQQTLSSDDENDDTPGLEDLRDVLKRKFESEDSNSSTHNDLRTTLDARKSRRISTGYPDPKERSNGDLRDKLNAGACDLRIPPAAKNANTRQEPRQHAPIDKNGRKDGYMYVVNENNVPVSTLVVRGEGWNNEGDSSADDEQPANRRRIEVILAQQTLSSDDENDDTSVLEDLRDVLKRKFESEDRNSSTHNYLRTTLDARKSRRISTGDPDPKERVNGDLRDKLNAGACDLRIRLNRSKSNDLRRRLEQPKTSSNDTTS
ncbi:hypothetical protein F2Q68_00010904 [Brassica cretica]|uniref:Uncharacterized protein n=1 Tax=Brassica cretica TaxID=69181 RepID=A0A8S9KMZ5_BRACR|nr:hypothetical protein F2Q68_00010904 [Brassica cretica]